MRKFIFSSKNVFKQTQNRFCTTSQDDLTIFDHIISKKIPSEIVYEDEKCLAFRDIQPMAPTHILLIPKIKDGLSQLALAQEHHKDILGHLMYTSSVIAKQQNLKDGWRLVVNNGQHARGAQLGPCN